MPKQSAGLLAFRRRCQSTEVFLVHPGGPFWMNRDEGAWSIPKGEFATGGDPLATAMQEFQEETGIQINGDFLPLEPIKQRGGKVVHAWLVEADFEPVQSISNKFTIEWPPRSGQMAEFPEVDRAEWFDLPIAYQKILESQRPLLDQFRSYLGLMGTNANNSK